MSAENADLDPADWAATRDTAHRMLDDMLDFIVTIRERPVWRPIPDTVRGHFREALPRAPMALDAVHEEFREYILPYGAGNVHPGFMGWVQGAGTVTGMLAEMLAAGLNANLGGRDQAPLEVERQIVLWMRQLFGFPDTASGLFVTGASMANFLGLLVARTEALGAGVRQTGLCRSDRHRIGGLRAYASTAAHNCVVQAMEMSGLGAEALRQVAADQDGRIDVAALGRAIIADRAQGLSPFLVVASAGTVDRGAIDDLNAVAALCRDQGLWLHVDGAYGALGMLSPELAPRLKGLERADSIAFDFHKWGQVPYDAGFLLVRDGQRHQETFAAPAAYLRREARGLAGGSPWPCDFGPDLSRGFRALKTWFTLKVHGADAIAAGIERSCALARYLETRLRGEARLQVLAPAYLNIVCFRFRAPDADSDALNAAILADVQEAGIAAPSSTMIGGRLAIRAALFNHRTRRADIDAMVDAVLQFGMRRTDKVP
jgi:aromatic-L-amino-acid decarboxylase